MRTAFWTIVALLLPFCATVARTAHQTNPSTADPTQSTMRGVYTAAQARRGEETYMAVCVSCHPTGTYKTAAFKDTWRGRALSELYDQVREKMPKNDPASLTPAEYAQVVAYLLKINDVPSGETELAADSEAMKKIRIEIGR